MLKPQIERGQEVNAFLFDAIGAVCFNSNHDIESGFRALNICFAGHPLYWVYKGGNHIAIQSKRHTKRIAILTAR